VMVMLYPTVVVWAVVVIVTAAFAGGVTVFGLTAHVGVEVVICVDETWQVKSTVPLKPLTVPIVMLEEDVPPGATASGENGAACRVKSAWAAAGESKVRNAVVTHKAASAACPARIFSLGFDNLNFDNLDFDKSDFNMCRFK
jgi:hypothetical protein